jgi:hypothetical protein
MAEPASKYTQNTQMENIVFDVVDINYIFGHKCQQLGRKHGQPFRKLICTTGVDVGAVS